ncbi:RNA polymerase-binding protein DksA [Scleromatobacter humisilvae]|uniref:RNA polymerase-binding transcription factor DksA n=1 Tax=Scleromatobacter humisilvae TaxID=2897159 RepID=A0A9X1YN57_9BURK|nr:RNA polymerase-binding protein DksA [Scleromatobacter humisilvae]MCK9689081.1 RNA polymerase-binding protein DksA [Scleromatobacter humisilvae]
MTKTPAKTLASSTATADGADTAATKSRAKSATKVSSPADGAAAATPLKKPSAKAETEPMNAAKSSATDTKLASAWKTKAGKDLTEPELLAMPDSEYMGEKQLEFFRAKLQALKDDLLSNAGETTEHLREDTSIVPDPADRATIEEEHALELRTRDRERKLLKKISQSIGRIDAGDYGYCDETGEPIGLGRLLARPTATLSLEAQQRREMKQKMFGD